MSAAEDPIRFNRAVFSERSRALLAEALAGETAAGDGPFGKRCERLLQDALGVHRALLTTSCSHALDMAAMLLDLGPGDEVILPSFTFVSTANAVVLRGARPVFADIRPDTFNIDERAVERLITPRTRAVVAMHYGGIACEMEAIGGIAARAGAAVVEDNAHGLFGTYRGRPLGTLGTMAALSFHETKNITCGEGGALLVNDPALAERAEIIREKGTDRSRFFRGQVDKYTWVDAGSSYVQSDLLAALLLGQLEEREAIQADRQRLHETYAAALAGWADRRGVMLPFVPEGCGPAWHLFSLLMPTPAARDAMIAHLAARGVMAVFHYLPLHASPMGQRFGGRPGDCPVTESVSARLLRLPFHRALGEADVARVIEAVLAFPGAS